LSFKLQLFARSVERDDDDDDEDDDDDDDDDDDNNILRVIEFSLRVLNKKWD